MYKQASLLNNNGQTNSFQKKVYKTFMEYKAVAINMMVTYFKMIWLRTKRFCA